MNKSLIILALAVLTCLSGCPVISINPLFTDKEAFFDQSITGHWTDGEARWVFDRWVNERDSSEKSNFYIVSIIGNNILDSLDSATDAGNNKSQLDTAIFRGTLGRLGKHLFMDLYPIADSWSAGHNNFAANLFNQHKIAVHSILRLEKRNDSLVLTSLDSDWLDDMINKKKITIQHQACDMATVKPENYSSYVITAPTRDIQKMVARYAADTAAFKKPDLLGRIR